MKPGHECPQCKIPATLDRTLFLPDIARDSKSWLAVSKEPCPGCGFRVAAGWFATEEEARDCGLGPRNPVAEMLRKHDRISVMRFDAMDGSPC